MAARQLVGGFLRDAIGEAVVGLVPAVVIPWGNPRRRGEHLAEQRAAIFNSAKGALSLVPKLDIGREQRRLSLRRCASGRRCLVGGGKGVASCKERCGRGHGEHGSSVHEILLSRLGTA